MNDNSNIQSPIMWRLYQGSFKLNIMSDQVLLHSAKIGFKAMEQKNWKNAMECHGTINNWNPLFLRYE